MVGKHEYSDKFLRDLHLIQYAILVPKLTNIVELKKRLGIRLSEAEIRHELNNPRSPLYKYMLDMIMTCIILMKAEHARLDLLQAEEGLKESRVKQLARIEERLRELASHQHFAFEEKQNFEKRVYELTLLAALEARKYEELKFWLQFLKSDMYETVRDLVDKRYELIQKNLSDFEDALSRNDLTTDQRERIEEHYENYQRHLELSSPEMKTRILGDILRGEDTESAADNKIRIEQAVRKDNVQEELFGKFLKNILYSEKQEQRNMNEEIGKEEALKPETSTPSEPVSKYDKSKNNKWRYMQLADVLNNKLVSFFEKKENKEAVLVSYPEVEKLVAMLHEVNHKREEASQLQLDKQIEVSLKSLLANDSQLEITQFLQKWLDEQNLSTSFESSKLPHHGFTQLSETKASLESKQSQHAEIHTNVTAEQNDHSELFQILDDVKEVLAHEIELIENIRNSFLKMKDNKEKAIENIINSFNELSLKYPEEPKVMEMYHKLSMLDIIKDKINEPTPSTSADYTF